MTLGQSKGLLIYHNYPQILMWDSPNAMSTIPNAMRFMKLIELGYTPFCGMSLIMTPSHYETGVVSDHFVSHTRYKE